MRCGRSVPIITFYLSSFTDLSYTLTTPLSFVLIHQNFVLRLSLIHIQMCIRDRLYGFDAAACDEYGAICVTCAESCPNLCSKEWPSGYHHCFQSTPVSDGRRTSNGKKMGCILYPVSYTHLDVYKRHVLPTVLAVFLYQNQKRYLQSQSGFL